MTTLVTGAAGAVGEYIVRLLDQLDDDILCLDKDPLVGRFHRLPKIQALCKSTTDLTEEDLRGVTKIIHAASNLSLDQTFEEVIENNIQSTSWITKLAQQRRIIFISSASIYASSENPIVEWDPLCPSNTYETGKIIEERVITAVNNHVTILRPALIYGPGCKALGAAVATIPSLLRNKTGWTIGFTGGPRTNWVHAEDVARAAVFCLNHKETENKIFNVADNTPLPFGDMISAHIRADGQRIAFSVPLPSPKALSVLRPLIDRETNFRVLNAILAKIWTKKEIKLQLEKSASSYLFQDTVFDTDRLEWFGFRLKHPDPRQSLPDVMNWYKRKGWI